jgi:hypothetical protein
MSMKEVDAIIKNYNDTYINGWEQVRLLRNTIGSCMGVKLQPLKFSWDTETIEAVPTPENRIEAEQKVMEWFNNLNMVNI